MLALPSLPQLQWWEEVASPKAAGAGPWQGVALEGWGMRAFKGSSERLTTCLPLDTSVTMWFLVLCLSLSLAGTGKTSGRCGRGAGPDSHAALIPPPSVE